ncbi:hypothetical protein HMPREF9120_02441 [Neisseria sp. oral taxon 020 str. F0370]|nr:hypothetical protein HMPREF9120_02441 [Neisseria sp. oral taxon 020 str. F0370]
MRKLRHSKYWLRKGQMSAAGRLFRRPAARQDGIIRHKHTLTA